MNSSLPVLDGIRIASPCPASWDAMIGDDRQRACAACGKDVYNLASLTTAEALALVNRPGESACVRFYRRGDGTVMTADCPVGMEAIRGGRLLRALAVGVGLASAATVALATALVYRPELQTASRPPTIPEAADADLTLPDPAAPGTATPSPTAEIKALVTNWIDDALVRVGLRQPTIFLGDIDRIPLDPAAIPNVVESSTP